MRKSYLPLTRNCLLLLLLCIPMGQAFADWYPAPIDYRQTMTVVVGKPMWTIGRVTRSGIRVT